MMNIHYCRAIDIDEIINIFATRHPRRLVLKDILTDKQSEWNRVFFVELNCWLEAIL